MAAVTRLTAVRLALSRPAGAGFGDAYFRPSGGRSLVDAARLHIGLDRLSLGTQDWSADHALMQAKCITWRTVPRSQKMCISRAPGRHEKHRPASRGETGRHACAY